MSKIVPFTVNKIHNPLIPQSTDEKTILTKQSTKPLLFLIVNGKVETKIRLKLQKPVFQLNSIVFKNAGSAFVTIMLGEQVIYATTQQFSLEQLKNKRSDKLNKLKMHKINNKFTTKNVLYEDVTIVLTSFYDIEFQHAIGLHWIEFVST